MLELALQPLKQCESVGGGAGEAADNLPAFADAADLLRIGLDDRIAEADLAVAGDDGLAALLDANDRRSVILFHDRQVGGATYCCKRRSKRRSGTSQRKATAT